MRGPWIVCNSLAGPLILQALTLLLLRLLSSNAQKKQKKYENRLNPVMLVFI